MVGVDVSQLSACHWLLLRIAGTAADDLVHRCRQWLAEGRALDVGRAVAYAVVSQRIRLADADIDLLTELLAADGADTSALSMISVQDTDPMPLFGFAATRSGIHQATGIAAADVNPVELLINAAPEDEIERRALRAASMEPAVRALWRSWRYPGDGAPWPRPRRIWVLETDGGADLAGIAGRTQAVLDRSGETCPQVEVYPTRAKLPGYQSLARSYGALMWSRTPDPGLRLAAVFDRAVGAADSRAMAPDHPVLEPDEAQRVSRYLAEGETVLVTPGRMDDVVDPARRDAVPMCLVTDGFWIWCQATQYYLDQYRLAPDLGLLSHIRDRQYVPTLVDGAAVYRASAFLHDPSARRKIWTIGA